jgi:hypothetical protein
MCTLTARCCSAQENSVRVGPQMLTRRLTLERQRSSSRDTRCSVSQFVLMVP